MDNVHRLTFRILAAAAPLLRRLMPPVCCAVALGACNNSAQAPASPAAHPGPATTASAADRPAPTQSEAAPTSADGTEAAQASSGHYATERGWGQLAVQPDARFTLETQNVDAGCSFSGTLRGTQAAVDDGAGPGTCTLRIATRGNGVTVAAAAGAENACREYCGGNGSFAGDYLKLDAACAPDAMQRTRKAFQALYERKDYTGAEAALAPLSRNCVATLRFSEAGAIRNDYALTQHKLGDDAGCLQTLAPYRDDAKRSDDAISEGMTPALVDDYLGVIRAARSNRTLCGGGQG